MKTTEGQQQKLLLIETVLRKQLTKVALSNEGQLRQAAEVDTKEIRL